MNFESIQPILGSSFYQVEINFGFDAGQQALGAELATRLPQMQNIINLIISRKTKEDLKTLNDQLDLREEIKAHINHILTNGKIKGSLHTSEFIVN